MPEIANVRYTHDACIDAILANPAVSQNELAATFGYSAAWMSIVINSDAFRTRLAARKSELVDPVITAACEERMRALASRSMDVLLEKLEAGDGKTALEALKIVAPFVAQPKESSTPRGNVNLYVVQAPPRARDSAEWSASVGKTYEAGEAE